ncbi:MAG: hypothetical protein Kow0062_10250 [Acidobacteriota bacterium]
MARFTHELPPPVAEAFALFDEGDAHEAHERLEQVWRTMPRGEERIFWQGLIQAMVARVHWERGRFDSARTLIARARPKLARSTARYLGLDVGTLLARLDTWDACLAARRVPAADEATLGAAVLGSRPRDGRRPAR